MRLSKISKRNKRQKHDNLTGYIFIMPWLLGFLAFTVIPMVSSLYLSFTRYDILSSPLWIGLGNYSKILINDDKFWQSIKITFFFVLISVPLRLIFALFLAILFAQKRMMVGLYRTLFYIPSLIGGSVAIAVMWRQLFGVEGALNSILIYLGIGKNFGWTTNPKTALWTIILLSAWQFGSPMLIFLAGLKQIPTSLYEAASIDGANWWVRFSRITIPMLSPIIFFNLLMQTISGFMMFTEAYIITRGGPFERTTVYTLYLFNKAFSYYEMGYASALAWILLFILAIITLIFFKTAPHWVYYESKGDF
jgi:multiple sugar transport system permease protein